MSATITPKVVTKVTIRVIRVRGLVPPMDRAARKLAEDKARQTVNRAVNAWLYSQ